MVQIYPELLPNFPHASHPQTETSLTLFALWAFLCKYTDMFADSLKEKYSFLTSYFEQGIKNPSRAISHSILFYGNDIQAQFDLATEISRILNCKASKMKDCSCTNCEWIKNKQHPAVITISKLDNKPSDDDSKTVISIKQSQMIKNSLITTSDYHRVFIFCDAIIENEKWSPLGLNEGNFHSETANSLLKIIEEPPQNTTFFFLTRDKNDLIETIISRSQSFFVPSFDTNEFDISSIQEVFGNYPQLERQKSFELADSLFQLSKETSAKNILNQIQNYILELMKSNTENLNLTYKLINDTKVVEHAKKQLDEKITPQLVFEDLCLNLTQA